MHGWPFALPECSVDRVVTKWYQTDTSSRSKTYRSNTSTCRVHECYHDGKTATTNKSASARPRLGDGDCYNVHNSWRSTTESVMNSNSVPNASARLSSLHKQLRASPQKLNARDKLALETAQHHLQQPRTDLGWYPQPRQLLDRIEGAMTSLESHDARNTLATAPRAIFCPQSRYINQPLIPVAVSYQHDNCASVRAAESAQHPSVRRSQALWTIGTSEIPDLRLLDFISIPRWRHPATSR